MAFNFEPTNDAEVNDRFCWLLIDWLVDAERTAATNAISASRRGEPEDEEMKTPSRRHYEAVVQASRDIASEMRGFSGLHNPTHDADSIARMIDPAIHPDLRIAVEVRTSSDRFAARLHEKYGSGTAIVQMLVRQAEGDLKKRPSVNMQP